MDTPHGNIFPSQYLSNSYVTGRTDEKAHTLNNNLTNNPLQMIPPHHSPYG